MSDPLTWEDSYAIARELIRLHPDIPVEDLSLETIYHWTVRLPGFADDPGLANDAVLMAIYREWYEEINPI